jgi:hypothetical protein
MTRTGDIEMVPARSRRGVGEPDRRDPRAGWARLVQLARRRRARLRRPPRARPDHDAAVRPRRGDWRRARSAVPSREIIVEIPERCPFADRV